MQDRIESLKEEPGLCYSAKKLIVLILKNIYDACLESSNGRLVCYKIDLRILFLRCLKAPGVHASDAMKLFFWQILLEPDIF